MINKKFSAMTSLSTQPLTATHLFFLLSNLERQHFQNIELFLLRRHLWSLSNDGGFPFSIFSGKAICIFAVHPYLCFPAAFQIFFDSINECFSIFISPHDISKSDAARITKLDIEMFCHES